MKTKFIILSTILFTASIVLTGSAYAQEVNFPIAELGNCIDKQDCKLFCDKPENNDACLSFAKKNKLMSEEEVNRA